MSQRISLQQIQVLEPCHENWSDMAGDAQQRFCDHCEKHVHDLSSMTRAQAERLLAANAGGHICVRYKMSPAGEPITADAPPRVRALDYATRPRSRRMWPFAAFVATLAAGASMVLGFFRSTPDSEMMGKVSSNVASDGAQPTTQPVMMGDVAVGPTTQPTTQPIDEPTTKPVDREPPVMMGVVAPRALEHVPSNGLSDLN